ncbi:MEIOTIC F-BOX protein MOF-like isoform X1 [Triticum dicoccoides]|uniref:MEIOTIC F-BOX protein MOF-like isoform X1 n=1 Tax=Triticum dicoccoides TaxID=85692 RepID=UPI00188EEC3D|nr:MEIOTIC F-BOX protein MOF-like isoform X1 [Triticum dicoccoides]XP_037485718.1 MEIOTIC F-BOX protein MOF-like isoform X1 [Triticum dicoccoides]
MSPEPAAKRASSGGGHAVAFAGDRLSDLPDGLLHAVMSFLPAPQVVRTSVLSRRWRDLWRSTPCISIEERDFEITTGSGAGGDLDERQERWRKFEDFTTNLLLFHNNVASLDKFRLYAGTGRACALRLRDLDRWVRRGIKYRPQVIEIIISLRPRIQFPHMGASSCRLKRLHLNGFYLDNQFAELLCFGCPVLEDLVLRSCDNGFQEIKSSTLKKLVVDSCGNLSGDPVVIVAPHVAYLQLGISYGCYSNGVSIYETASLVKASIHLLCLGEAFNLKHQQRLLGNLCNVPNLQLSGFHAMAMLVEESIKFPIFANLQTLSLEQCLLDKCELDTKLDALGSFVQNAPCLEKLTLQCCMFPVESEKEGQLVRKNIILQRHDQNTFLCPKLKVIEVVYEEDHDHQLVELLWGIGRRLPNANIVLNNYFVD